MAEVSTLFWDNGGVFLTNGWDRTSRRAAVDKFKLDWADFEDRHELMLNDFETGRATLDEYLRRVVFYRERPFTPDDFKKFMFEQSQPLVRNTPPLSQNSVLTSDISDSPCAAAGPRRDRRSANIILNYGLGS